MWGNLPEWKRFASSSLQSMQPVILRKYANTDIEEVSDFTLSLWCACSEQPQDRKVKARSCMEHMFRWAESKDLYHGDLLHPDKEVLTAKQPKKSKTAKVLTEKAVKKSKVESKPVKKGAKQVKKPSKSASLESKPVKTEPSAEQKPVRNKSYTKPETKRVDKHPEHLDSLQDYADDKNINMYDSENKCGRKCTGTIYHDNASRGWKNGKRVFKDCWRAEITIRGQRYRYRSKDRDDCVNWLKAVKQGKIKPTDNKADWWRMEQHKDEAARIDEIIVNAAEESVMLYDYHQTKDIKPICEYLTQRLLPHMAYYCAHTLKFGKDRTLTASRQAAALLLTRIVAGKPVLNFTATCKRMLRLHKQRGDFFYYEKAPEEVKLMVNKIDLSPLAEVWKVTKDRRI